MILDFVFVRMYTSLVHDGISPNFPILYAFKLDARVCNMRFHFMLSSKFITPMHCNMLCTILICWPIYIILYYLNFLIIINLNVNSVY